MLCIDRVQNHELNVLNNADQRQTIPGLILVVVRII